jgi:hypothetical protein
MTPDEIKRKADFDQFITMRLATKETDALFEQARGYIEEAARLQVQAISVKRIATAQRDCQHVWNSCNYGVGATFYTCQNCTMTVHS